METQEALNSEKSTKYFYVNWCLAVVSVDQNAQFCNMWCLKQPLPARKLMFLEIGDFLWIPNIQLAIAKILFKKCYIGSWELAKHVILENLVSKTIVSCPQINDFENYRFLQIPIVSWMFPKMVSNCWMVGNISTMYSTEFASSIRYEWLTFLFCYASSYSFYAEHIDKP